MKAATIIGILAATGFILMGGMMEKVSPTQLVAPAPVLIVIGGTFGAVLASFGMEGIKGIPIGYKKAFAFEPPSLGSHVEKFVGFADTARRDGLLALEAEIDQIDDPFTKKGLQLVVDGTDPDDVRDILDLEIMSMQTRHKVPEAVFRSASGFAPTMGVLGTVVSLVHVLGNLDDPSSLGPAISVAFLATLWGVGAANVIFLPVATRLKEMSGMEAQEREMLLEGVLAVQRGDNPRMVAEKLMTYVPPAERDAVAQPGASKLSAVDEKKAA